MIQILPEYPIKRDSLVFEDLDDSQEVLVIDDADGSSLSLNLIATSILECCDGKHNIHDMTMQICDVLEADQDIVEKDITCILEEFAAFGLLQESL
ncbi:MAG: PqqD family protein [Mariprofundaceae bacterium]|nr:PqqD family protein [Mariprofundaceae bacterium]